MKPNEQNTSAQAKRYLMFCELAYAFPILRPLQDAIRKRGDECAWFLVDGCPNMLNEDEVLLHSSEEVKAYNPVAVFAPGNWIYPSFPGVKVQVFHGYPINKRADKVDDHFRMRGWFDMYCTSGPSSTPEFNRLAEKLKYFKVYETGWCKADSLANAKAKANANTKAKPTIFVASTFSKNISSLHVFFPIIKQLAEEMDWNWIVTKHPKLHDEHLETLYADLAATHENVRFSPQTDVDEMAHSDVMLCDSSSIIVEYLLLDKPVVTYRNTRPDSHLINIYNIEDIRGAIEKALTRPDELMQAIRAFASYHEAHMDGQNCERILDSVDDFVANYKGRLKRKPLNLIRRIKLGIRH